MKDHVLAFGVIVGGLLVGFWAARLAADMISGFGVPIAAGDIGPVPL